MYFPQDAYYVTASKLELAKFYLQLERRADALPIFVELAARDPSERAARAAGLAGQAIIGAQEKDLPRARRALEQLFPLAESLDPSLARMLVETPPLSEGKMPQPMQRDWETLRRQAQESNEAAGGEPSRLNN